MTYLEHLNSNYIDKTINSYFCQFIFSENVNQSTIRSPLNNDRLTAKTCSNSDRGAGYNTLSLDTYRPLYI